MLNSRSTKIASVGEVLGTTKNCHKGFSESDVSQDRNGKIKDKMSFNQILDAGRPSHTIATVDNSDSGGVLTLFNTNPGSASFNSSIQSFQSRSFEFAIPIMPRSVALNELELAEIPLFKSTTRK